MRVVADTNTIVSALLWRGNPHRLIAAIDDYPIAFYTSRVLLDEFARVLACALAAQADWIVSGDAHLLNLKHYQACASSARPRRCARSGNKQ